jgi:phosphomannomutase/phosphoglucomutase
VFFPNSPHKRRPSLDERCECFASGLDPGFLSGRQIDKKTMRLKNTSTYAIPEKISPSIFRAYDIRGIVEEHLTPDVVHAIALAIGTKAQLRHQKSMIIARDGRLSSPILSAALSLGLLESGLDVIDIGVVPTPVLYFATHLLGTNSGVMLTGSHNPKNYNGLKIILEGFALDEKEIQALHQCVKKRDFILGNGAKIEKDVVPAYIARITQDVKLAKPLKVVIDAGNGVTASIAPRLFQALGCDVVELFCEMDGLFPNHHPDPSVAENLKDLQKAVVAHHADIGLAFDGDGDRLGVVTDQGHIIWPDRQMMLFAQDVLSRQPQSQILFDVKCTQHLGRIIEKANGIPVMWKTGHSFIKSKMREVGASLAGEMSGHIFFKERWYGFDDGLYAGARLLEILSKSHVSSDAIFKTFPDSFITPEIKIPLSDDRKNTFMSAFLKNTTFDGAEINTIDGLRADFKNGWGLVRLSNTTPCLTLRFEADNEKNLADIQHLFKEKLLKIDNHLDIPF